MQSQDDDQYGELKIAHLRQLMEYHNLPERLREARQEVINKLSGAREQNDVPAAGFKLSAEDREKLELAIEHPIPWASFYDESFERQLATCLIALGLSHVPRNAALSPDPQHAILNAPEASDDDSDFTPAHAISLTQAYGLVEGVRSSFDCLCVFGSFINEMVAAGKAGKDKAFFDAIRIDPSVVCTEAFKDRLSRAVVKGQSEFLEDMRKALVGKTEKHKSQINQIRLVIRALIDAGGAVMPDDRLYALFVEKLRIYSPGEDGAKALKKHVGIQQKITSTQKR